MEKDKLDELIDRLAKDFKDMDSADENGDTDLRELRRATIRFEIRKYAEEARHDLA